MGEIKSKIPRFKKPNWLRVKLPVGEEYKKVRKIVDKYKLNTICESGNCPNMGECWGAGTATFMILGNVCTRSCTFCAVATGRPPEYDTLEPMRVAKAIKKMGVKHAVITSVNILTIGQYLQPTKMHLEVDDFITPEIFEMYKEEGLRRGLKYVESGPLVRSSYHAERHVDVSI